MDNQELRSRMQAMVGIKSEEEKALRADLLDKVVAEPDQAVAENMLDRYNKSNARDDSNVIASSIISVLDDDMLGRIETEVRNRHENSFQRLTPSGVAEFILEDRCKDKGIGRTSSDITSLRSFDSKAYDAKPSRFEYKVAEPPVVSKVDDMVKQQQMSYTM